MRNNFKRVYFIPIDDGTSGERYFKILGVKYISTEYEVGARNRLIILGNVSIDYTPGFLK